MYHDTEDFTNAFLALAILGLRLSEVQVDSKPETPNPNPQIPTRKLALTNLLVGYIVCVPNMLA
jgi:hypothetical protein